MIEPAYAHVLVVEDGDDNFYVVEDLLLNEIGVKSCTRCRDGNTLIPCMDEPAVGLIDLILFDIKRPLREDFALVPTIRVHPKLSSARIIALTANIMFSDVERTRQAGFDGFIGLPVNQQRFANQIRRVLADELVWEPR